MRVIITTGLFLFLAGNAWSQDLTPSSPVKGKLEIGDSEEPATRNFNLMIPTDAVAAEVTLESDIPIAFLVTEADVPAEEDYLLPEADKVQRVRLVRGGMYDLYPGKWSVSLTLTVDDLYTYGYENRGAVSFTLSVKIYHLRVDGKIQINESKSLVIDPSKGPFQTYEIELGAEVRRLRFDTICPSADLSMWIFEGSQGLLDEEPLAASRLAGGVDRMIFGEEDGLGSGKYYLTVADPEWNDWKVPFRLGCSTTGAAEKSFLALPEIPAGKSSLERAIYSTVNVICESGGGGSGVFISDKGYLLTNYHVVQFDMDDKLKIWVAPTIDVETAPVEGFLVEVVEVEKARDLALLRVVSGAFGQKIPAGYKFPAMPLSKKERVKIGDPLTVLGYPSVGGSVGRLTLTLSRGIVSGFEPHGKDLMVKTDADINSGNSGGPVVDDRNCLVGLATETVGNDDGGPGQMGYLRPVWIVPTGWWKTAGARR